MKNFSKFIKNYDGYGQKIIININGDETVKSFSGGICYLLDRFCLFAILLLNLYNFFFLPEPLITISEIFRNQKDIEKISPENLMLSNFFVKWNDNGTLTPLVTKPNGSICQEINLKNDNGKVDMITNYFGNFGDCDRNKVYIENEKFKPIFNKLKKFSNEDFLTCFNLTIQHFSIGGNIVTNDESSSFEIISYYNICDFLY